MEQVITAVDAAGRSFPTTCRVTTLPGRRYRLKLESPEIGGEVAEANDVFECLSIVRLRFDQEGVKLCCNGARRDVWPSGMARDMGGGFKAYLLSIGKVPEMSDLVDVFEPAPLEAIASVEEQRQFFQSWLNAPRK